MRQLLPLALSANTVVVMWLAGNKKALAWALGLLGQAGWLAFVLVFAAWGLLPLVVVLSFVYARNLLRWTAQNAAPSVGGRGTFVVNSPGLPAGYSPPSASLKPPREEV